MALAERARPGTILAAGVTATLATLLLTIPAAGLADAALVAASALLASGTGALWWESRRLASLPLEVAPIAAAGVVDGAVVYRFRARLGRGRALRSPEARITFEPDGGAPVELAPGPLPASACGPLTLIVRDPTGLVRPPGRFRIGLRVLSAGRTWSAEAVVPLGSVTAGRFDGISITNGRLTFDEPWDAVRPEKHG